MIEIVWEREQVESDKFTELDDKHMRDYIIASRAIAAYISNGERDGSIKDAIATAIKSTDDITSAGKLRFAYQLMYLATETLNV